MDYDPMRDGMDHAPLITASSRGMGGDALVAWASEQSNELLSDCGDRWRHVLGVVARARELAPILHTIDASTLVAAAFLHDIGWAQELCETGFHPLDGAIWLRRVGRERLACLVANHSGSVYEAEIRGLNAELAEFPDEDGSAVADALTYCDVTTDPAGLRVVPEQRWAEIERRYGPDDVVVAALHLARSDLEAAVRRTLARMKAAGLLPEEGAASQL